MALLPARFANFGDTRLIDEPGRVFSIDETGWAMVDRAPYGHIGVPVEDLAPAKSSDRQQPGENSTMSETTFPSVKPYKIVFVYVQDGRLRMTGRAAWPADKERLAAAAATAHTMGYGIEVTIWCGSDRMNVTLRPEDLSRLLAQADKAEAEVFAQ